MSETPKTAREIAAAIDKFEQVELPPRGMVGWLSPFPPSVMSAALRAEAARADAAEAKRADAEGYDHAVRAWEPRIPCGDHGCDFEAPTGMATNGGCRCLHLLSSSARVIIGAAVRRIRARADFAGALLAQALAERDAEVDRADKATAAMLSVREALESDAGLQSADCAWTFPLGEIVRTIVEDKWEAIARADFAGALLAQALAERDAYRRDHEALEALRACHREGQIDKLQRRGAKSEGWQAWIFSGGRWWGGHPRNPDWGQYVDPVDAIAAAEAARLAGGWPAKGATSAEIIGSIPNDPEDDEAARGIDT